MMTPTITPPMMKYGVDLVGLLGKTTALGVKSGGARAALLELLQAHAARS